MKTLLPLLTLFCLVTFSSLQPIAVEENLKVTCCKHSGDFQIPRNRIKHVEMSPSTCGHEALIVTAKSGKQFCVDPNSEWSKARLAEFNRTQTARSKQ